MKLLAPLLLLGVQAGKEELAAQCQAAKTEFPNCACDNVFWKGGKLTKKIIHDNKLAFIMSSIPDDAAAWKFRDSDHDNFDPNYKIFLQFVRHKCGVSFVEGVADGTVQFHFMDSYAAYSGTVYTSQIEKYAYGTDAFATGSAPAKKYWVVTVQGHSGNTLDSSAMLHNAGKMRGDLPYDGKNDVFAIKKDQVQVLVTGLEDVEFSATQRDACFEGAFVGIAQDASNTNTDDTECMGLAHIYW